MSSPGSKKQPPRAGQVNKVKALDPGDIIVKKEGSALKSSSSRFLNVGPQEKLERLPKIRSMSALRITLIHCISTLNEC